MKRLGLVVVVLMLIVGQSASAEAPMVGVFGTALELLPPGEPGRISIIAVGPYGEIGVPIIVRNNAEETVYDLSILATIRDENGTLIAAEDSWLLPSVFEPGAMTFDRIPFWGDLPGPPPVGSTYTFEAYATTEAASSKFSDPIRGTPLQVRSAERSGSQIIGRAVNTSERPLAAGPGGPTIRVLCFNNAGEATELYGAGVSPVQPIDVGAEFPFSTSTEEPIDAVCDRFLVIVYAIG